MNNDGEPVSLIPAARTRALRTWFSCLWCFIISAIVIKSSMSVIVSCEAQDLSAQPQRIEEETFRGRTIGHGSTL
jgi:hypothetical protein